MLVSTLTHWRDTQLCGWPITEPEPEPERLGGRYQVAHGSNADIVGSP